MADSGTNRGLTTIRISVALLSALTIRIGVVGGRLWTPLVGVVVLVAALLALAGVTAVSQRRAVWLTVAVLLVVLIGYDILFGFFPPIGNPP